MFRVLLVILGIWLSMVTTVVAQEPIAVTVRVVARDGIAIGGVLVRLVDDGETVVQRLTDASGFASFEIAVRGRYRFVAERIGFAPWESEPLLLDSSLTRPIELRMRVEAVPLQEIAVEAEARCSQRRPFMMRMFGALRRLVGGSGSDGDAGATRSVLARMHSQTMASLRSVIGSRLGASGYTVRIVEESPVLRNESVVVGTAFDTTVVQQPGPLVGPAAEFLAESGFAVAPHSDDAAASYYAPTPEVVTSEVFTLTHCFQVVDDVNSGWTGLAFEPLPGSRGYDVRGVIWMDTIAWRAERIDFFYTRLNEFLIDSGEWDRARQSGREREKMQLQSRLRAAMDMEGVRLGGGTMTHVAPTVDESEFGGSIHFGPDSGAGWDIVRWHIRWPGLVARGVWGGAIRAPDLRSDCRVASACGAVRASAVLTGAVLRFSRTGEVVGIIGKNEFAAIPTGDIEIRGSAGVASGSTLASRSARSGR